MKIIVGHDGSEHSRRALERVAQLAPAGANVIVVSVVPVSPPAGRGPAAIDPLEAERHKQQLEEARALLAGADVHVDTIETPGNPLGDAGDALVHLARERAADLIVVGTRGFGTTKRVVLGSVSTKVVHDAPCDVLVVR